MKNKNILAGLLVIFILAGISPGCYKLQKDFKRNTTDTLNANLGKTAWAYLKSRAYDNPVQSDTIFRRMYDAIIYSGIDTNEYMKPNRTYIFFTNETATTKTTGIWATVLTSANKAATSFKSYSAEDVKNFLSYYIILGQYSHYNLPIYPITVNTLAPAGTYAAIPPGFKITGLAANLNPTSTMLLKVLDATNGNSSDYPIVINETYYFRTSDLLATNGVVDVINVPIFPMYPH